MNNTKINAKKYLFWLLLVPAGLAVLMTATFCILENNYYYLPYSLDFAIQLSYDLTYFFLLTSLFFGIGVIAEAIFFEKSGKVWLSVLVTVAANVVLPMILYFLKLFCLSALDEYAMADYFLSDVLCAAENLMRLAIAILIIFAVKFFLRHKGRDAAFVTASPFRLHAQQTAFLIFYGLWLALSVLTFLLSEEKDIGSLLYEICLDAGGYFLGNLGVRIFSQKIGENS